MFCVVVVVVVVAVVVVVVCVFCFCYCYKVLLLAVASGNFPLAQLVERLDTQTEGPWIESLQWRLIYLLHLEPT